MTPTRRRRKLKYLYREIDLRADSLEGFNDLPLLSVSIHRGVERREAWANAPSRAADLSSYKVVEPNDIVVNRMRAFQGALGLAGEPGLVSPDYLVLRPNNSVNPSWLATALRTPLVVGQMASLIRGIGSAELGSVRTPRINPDDLGQIEIDIPDSDEQRATVAYLHTETAKIDTLIAAQQQLISTLRERREAAIRAVLTRGLDRHVAMKESGNGLIGTVPSHWKVVPTRYLCDITTGGEDSGNATEDGPYPFYVRGRHVLRSDDFAFDCEAVMTPGTGRVVPERSSTISKESSKHTSACMCSKSSPVSVASTSIISSRHFCDITL